MHCDAHKVKRCNGFIVATLVAIILIYQLTRKNINITSIRIDYDEEKFKLIQVFCAKYYTVLSVKKTISQNHDVKLFQTYLDNKYFVYACKIFFMLHVRRDLENV